jgi:hypothetical protein
MTCELLNKHLVISRLNVGQRNYNMAIGYDLFSRDPLDDIMTMKKPIRPIIPHAKPEYKEIIDHDIS